MLIKYNWSMMRKNSKNSIFSYTILIYKWNRIKKQSCKLCVLRYIICSNFVHFEKTLSIVFVLNAEKINHQFFDVPFFESSKKIYKGCENFTNSTKFLFFDLILGLGKYRYILWKIQWCKS